MDADIIVIGSGAGGLAAALPLAQAGESIIVIEQHNVPGGLCHSFKKKGYRFSPGIHLCGLLNVNNNELIKEINAYLCTSSH